MVRRSCQPARDADEANTEGRGVTARGVGVRKLQEELASARCPLCRAVLVVRQGRAGPYFFCRCVRRKVKRTP